MIAQPPCFAIEYKIVPNNDDRSVTRYAAYCGDQPLSIQAWITTMSSDPAASRSLTHIICTSPYLAVYFETKGCHASNWNTKNFEFVLVDAPRLRSFAESSPDPEAFAEYFSLCASSSSSFDGCAFFNLSGDAKLIAPRATSKDPVVDNVAYSHLAAFCRKAPPDQVANVWQITVLEYRQRILDTASKSVWLSTSGTGVAWLHFRLDSRPKYYQYEPFRKET